jgi:arylsulfatase A-like enzyme
MIWNSPNVSAPGASTSSLCSALDLAPSILAQVGLAGFWGMQGLSIAPVLADPSAPLHSAVLIEEDGHEPLPGLDGPLRTRTLITNRHRLSIYDKIERVDLFDLAVDPHETRNLAGNSDYTDVQSTMFQSLSRRMMELCDWSPFPTGRA